MKNLTFHVGMRLQTVITWQEGTNEQETGIRQPSASRQRSERAATSGASRHVRTVRLPSLNQRAGTDSALAEVATTPLEPVGAPRAGFVASSDGLGCRQHRAVAR
jgi:hypothetical protein